MGENNKNVALPAALTFDDVRSVSPALEHYTKRSLLGGVWKRPGLSPRDRSVVTVAALIARIQNIEMRYHFALALDNGMKPSELSEIITHLAFYAGWANAMSAVFIAKDIFRQRGVGPDQLPPAKEKLLPINEEAEKQRATQVGNNFGDMSPGLVENTTDLLFRELWLRPALGPRDRSLVTVSALIANGQTAQISYHLGRAMDNGLTPEQASEVLQPIEQRLLTHAIIDRGYAEHSILAGFVPLRNRVLSHRQRLIGILFQLSLQPIQLLVQLLFKSLQSLPIHTPTAPVRFSPSPRPSPGSSACTPCQLMNGPSWHPSG